MKLSSKEILFEITLDFELYNRSYVLHSNLFIKDAYHEDFVKSFIYYIKSLIVQNKGKVF